MSEPKVEVTNRETIAELVANTVIQPVVVGDTDEIGVGIHVGENCRFIIPVGFVYGGDGNPDYLIEQLREVIKEAINMAFEFVEMTGGVPNVSK